MIRRKGTPCTSACDPCKGKNYVRAVNNVSPDPAGDLQLKAGNGIAISQSGDSEITIINDAIASSFVAGDNIEINPSGDNLEIRVTDDVSINNLNVAGDIIQQGAAYETHAEKIYTTKDYIYMREGAVGGLAAGALSGFEVIKYDGTNDGRLAIDNDGTARVGDVGNEQPLLTRDEAADLTNGNLLEWDATDFKAVDSGKKVSDFVNGSGNIGSDTKPVKIVNGAAVEVTNELQNKLTASAVQTASRDTGNTESGNIRYATYGKIVTGTFDLKITSNSTWATIVLGHGLPIPILSDLIMFSVDLNQYPGGWCSISSVGNLVLSTRAVALNGYNIRGSFTYISQ